MSAKLGLTMLEQRQALDTCAYCPKLCRTTCPVSRAEPSEVLTPWGKMTLARELTRSPSPPDTQDILPVWGCTGCGACTAGCRHKNPVEPTLYAARSEVLARGGNEPGARASQQNVSLEARLRVIQAAVAPFVGAEARQSSTALLLGCAYLTDPELTLAVVALARGLGGPVQVLSACCGAPFLHAGQAAQAQLAQRDLNRKVEGYRQVIVADPGCKVTCDTSLEAPSRLLLDHALDGITRFSSAQGASRPSYRWHDPCQLGRGLSRYQEPRRLLERVSGCKPLEFTWKLEAARCSGAGGALPRTLPEISERIADTRIEDHDALGGGTIVTACASSLRRFRSRGAAATDLHLLLARALAPGG